uniref:Heat shock factor-binding protein 1 n=1 Tax=Mesocestoides corti TaxID=53468 RepID=A0A5K3F9Y1_MESCO
IFVSLSSSLQRSWTNGLSVFLLPAGCTKVIGSCLVEKMATSQKEINGGDSEPENIQELTKTVK